PIAVGDDPSLCAAGRAQSRDCPQSDSMRSCWPLIAVIIRSHRGHTVGQVPFEFLRTLLRIRGLGRSPKNGRAQDEGVASMHRHHPFKAGTPMTPVPATHDPIAVIPRVPAAVAATATATRAAPRWCTPRREPRV